GDRAEDAAAVEARLALLQLAAAQGFARLDRQRLADHRIAGDDVSRDVDGPHLLRLSLDDVEDRIRDDRYLPRRGLEDPVADAGIGVARVIVATAKAHGGGLQLGDDVLVALPSLRGTLQNSRREGMVPLEVGAAEAGLEPLLDAERHHRSPPGLVDPNVRSGDRGQREAARQ